jgi:alanine or glycine:cation symporter, AGCS family
MAERIVWISDLFWNAEHLGALILLAVIAVTGLFFTLRLGVPQVRLLGRALAALRRRGAKGEKGETKEVGEVSPFQAFATAVGGTAGAAAIAGVATAISFGGPGAVLWLWVGGLLAMAAKLAETTIAVRYREVGPDHTVGGGPMHAIVRGLSPKLKALAWLFAIGAALAALGAGALLQGSTIAAQVVDAGRAQLGLEVPGWAAALVAAALVVAVTLGGARRTGKIAGWVVPILSALYAAAAVAVVAINADRLLPSLSAIFTDAFSGTAATGGFVGAGVTQALRWGLANGTIPTGAGLGVTPVIHAAARTDQPARQGLLAMLEPVVGTLLLGTLTALAVLTSGAWSEKLEGERRLVDLIIYGQEITSPEQAREPANYFEGVIRVRAGRLVGTVHLFEGRSSVDLPQVLFEEEPLSGVLFIDAGRVQGFSIETADRGLVNAAPGDLARLELHGLFLAGGTPLATAAFGSADPSLGLLAALALILFALTAALAWSYTGDRCARFMLGARAVTPFRAVFAAALVAGAFVQEEAAWAVAGVALAVMALPALFAVWALSPVAARARRLLLGLADAEEEEEDEAEGEAAEAAADAGQETPRSTRSKRPKKRSRPS